MARIGTLNKFPVDAVVASSGATLGTNELHLTMDWYNLDVGDQGLTESNWPDKHRRAGRAEGH